MSVSAYPLQWPAGWPRTPAHKRQDSRNRWGKGEGRKRRPWTFGEARDELYNELERFGARNLVVSTNFQLTQAGYPSRNFGVPDDQGVAIYFTLSGKQMVMAQDGHTRAEENLRALSLVLKYLRGVEELGGGTMMEKAFEGFQALPAPGAKKAWREVLMFGPDMLRPNRDMVEKRFRELARERHPDAGGSTAAMAELNAAKAEALKDIGNG